MSTQITSDVSERIRKLPPDKVDLLLRRLKRGSGGAAPSPGNLRRPFRDPADGNFYLDLKRPGNLDSLGYRIGPRQAPSPAEVEIEVKAASLNFRDLAIALGIYPAVPGFETPKLGCDAAGIITKVGSEVTRFKEGDEVVCLTRESTFSRYIVAIDGEVIHKAPGMSFEEASGIPLAFLTSYFALRGPGRLCAGDRVLIHSAAGGVGLAAVQIAQCLDAEIFATAGTPEKREFLRGLGIRHIMDSRTLDFVPYILEATNSEGVDVVLNSLGGDALLESFKLLRADGRFLELGKRDLAPGRMLDLSPFIRGLMFAAVDVNSTLRSPVAGQGYSRLNSYIAGMERDFAEGRLRALPIKVFPASKVADAFKYMAQGIHIGKIVVSMQSGTVVVETT